MCDGLVLVLLLVAVVPLHRTSGASRTTASYSRVCGSPHSSLMLALLRDALYLSDMCRVVVAALTPLCQGERGAAGQTRWAFFFCETRALDLPPPSPLSPLRGPSAPDPAQLPLRSSQHDISSELGSLLSQL